MEGDMAYINNESADNTVFQNRLIGLMKEQGISGASNLAHKLKEKHFLSQMKESSIEKTIQRHLRFESTDKESLSDTLHAPHIKAYCEFFNCSTDYLLGKTDVRSKDIEIRQICDRLGLTEAAVNAIIKMTGEETAISKVRMLPEESRAILSNILTADKFKDFIENIKQLDETYEKTEENNIWVELEKQIGKKRLSTAIEWSNKLESTYSGPDPSQEILDDVTLFNEVLDEGYEIHRKNEYDRKVYKFELHEIYSLIINEMYP
jgi:predicted transcriptional regulator